LLALLGAHHILHISRIKVNTCKLCTEEYNNLNSQYTHFKYSDITQYNNCSCRTIAKQCTVCHFVHTTIVQPKQQCNGGDKISGCELSRERAHEDKVKKGIHPVQDLGRERKTVFK